MLLDLGATARDLGRVAEIAGVLARYGFGEAAQRLGLASQVKGAEDLLHLGRAERARRVLQDLGPTFVKLGQLLATRVDLFPAEWIEEFEKLQDRAPPSDPGAVGAQLLEDLGAAPESIFAAFEEAPFAAGSVAQVHRARLADGAEVVVKVRRPGIVVTVEADLSLLARLARIAEARLPAVARFRPREIVRQLTRTLRAELDLAVECRSAERVAESFRDDPAIVVPKVYWDWTGERVNVQEYVDGVPSRDLAAVEAAGLDRRLLAQRGARAMLKMVLEDGFFHADPHPGNVFYLPGNRVAFIDFGMTGRLPTGRRDELVALLAGLVERDAPKVVDVLADWAEPTRIDSDAVTADVEAFIDRYHGAALSTLKTGAMLADLTQLLREQGLALPPDLALVLKVCVALEASGRELDPEFDMVGEGEPFLRAAIAERHGPKAIARRGWRALGAALDLMAEVPSDLRRIARAARNGRMQLHVDLTALESFGRVVDSAASRLTLGVVTAALIIGSSIVMTVEGGPTLFGLPLFGLAGFLAAAVGGVWLLVSILRSGRSR